MGNKSSLMLQEEEVRQISEETGFSASEIEKLYSRFSLLDRSNCGTLSKNDLLTIPELAINPLCDRLIQIVFSECDQDERINFRQFTRVLAPFRPSATSNNNNRNNNQIGTTNIDNNTLSKENPSTENNHDIRLESLKKKLSFVFKVYDIDNDGRISLNDIKCILRMMVGNFIEDFQLDKIAERVFAELDQDNDGFIEFGDFCKVFSAKDLNNKLRVKFVN